MGVKVTTLAAPWMPEGPQSPSPPRGPGAWCCDARGGTTQPGRPAMDSLVTAPARAHLNAAGPK
jgi:hypothetical protein